MTELEGHLLNALEHLQQAYMRRLNEWESAFADLQKMPEVTQRNNAILNERVVILSQQVQRLSGQVDRLTRVFFSNNRERMKRSVPGKNMRYTNPRHRFVVGPQWR